MSEDGVNWKKKLAKWLETNPKSAPPEIAQLRSDFVQRFPPDKVEQLTLEQYALGHPSSAGDSFCYWLEFKTRKLGSISGGSSAKFGVWWNKTNNTWRYNEGTYSTPDDALHKITHGVASLIDAVQHDDFASLDQIGATELGPNRFGLRAKPLYLYFPEKFLPIASPHYLRHALSTVGQPTDGDLIGLNRRLLQTLHGLPELAGCDPHQMMRFLYAELPLPPTPSPDGIQIWKIAPGENAKYWDMCHDNSCIVIHWLDDVDFRSYPDRNAIRQALISAGEPRGGASQIWRFTREVQPGNIVIANKGQDTVVGVGRVTSDYIAPHDEDNPSQDAKFRHAHRVEWLIDQSISVPFQLGRQTIRQLSTDQWDKIKAAYLADDPSLVEAFADLDGKAKPPPPLKDDSVPEALKHLWNVVERTRNVILYGPPGTGKTWITNRFVDYFLLQKNFPKSGKATKYWQAVQNRDQAASEQLRAEVRSDTEVEVNQVNFWWVTANPKQWNWTDLFKKGEKGEVFFEHGKVARNFVKVRDGDVVFGYSAHPTKKIVAIARIKNEDFTQTNGGHEVNGILLEPGDSKQILSSPISWQTIAADPLLGHSEPVVNNARGTLFHLTLEEAGHLVDLLRAAGNALNLPTQSRRNFAELITFHQSLAYEEFVEGLKPVIREEPAEDAMPASGDGQIQYEVVAGVFRRICRKAAANPENRYVLIIDEINRANIAKVFGELITLIEDDKRLGASNALSTTLPYSQIRFGVPLNLYILGTMNTADRSIALLDLALRRRFAFVEVPPDSSILQGQLISGIPLDRLLTEINARVATLLDDDHQIGHSYFLDVKDVPTLNFVWYHRILPLLQEYFYGDGERLKAVVGKKFVQEVKIDTRTVNALGDMYGSDRPRYRLVELDDTEFISALSDLVGTASAQVSAAPTG